MSLALPVSSYNGNISGGSNSNRLGVVDRSPRRSSSASIASPSLIQQQQQQHSQAHQQHNGLRIQRPLQGVVVPPLNFAMVAPGIYRSGFPNQRSHQFMLGLGIRTIIYLANDPKQSALDQHTQFALQNGITFKHYRLHHNNLPLEEMDIATVTEVLAILTNPTASTTGTQQYQHQHQHPVLVHCNKGVRRVGCVVGCLRRLQMWSMAAILDEFQRFSGDKIRINDQEFIESFDLRHFDTTTSSSAL